MLFDLCSHDLYFLTTTAFFFCDFTNRVFCALGDFKRWPLVIELPVSARLLL